MLPKRRENMDVIGHASDENRNSALATNDPTQVVPKSLTEGRFNCRFAMLRTEDEMIVKLSVSLRHGCAADMFSGFSSGQSSIVAPRRRIE